MSSKKTGMVSTIKMTNSLILKRHSLFPRKKFVNKEDEAGTKLFLANEKAEREKPSIKKASPSLFI